MITQSITNDRPDTVTVTFECSNKCNYSCWYCPPDLHNGSSPWPDLEQSLRFFCQLAEDNQSVYLDLAGGEPTMWPGLIDFLSALPSNVRHELSTNASRTLRWWKTAKPHLHKVSISLHSELCDAAHVISVIDLLRDSVEVHVTALLDLRFKQDIAEFGAEMKARGVSFQAKPIIPGWDVLIDYSAGDREFMDSLMVKGASNANDIKPSKVIWDGVVLHPSRDIIMQGKNMFRGWRCSVGSTRFHIAHDGVIYAGSCRNKQIGTLSTGWQIERSAITCMRDRCWCGDDIKTAKHLP